MDVQNPVDAEQRQSDKEKVSRYLEIFDISGVPIRWVYKEDPLNACHVSWNSLSKQWELVINLYTWNGFPAEGQWGILLHELYHLYRLDPMLVCLRNYDQELWNVASDVVINGMLQHNAWVQDCMLTYDFLVDLFGDPNLPRVRDAQPLYMYLRQKLNENLRNRLKGKMQETTGNDIGGEVPEEDRSDAIWKLLNIVRRGKRIATDSSLLDDDVREALEKLFEDTASDGRAGIGGSRELGILPPPECPAWYSKWLLWYRKVSTSILYSYRRKRSFRKEGIVEGLAGWGRKGNKKIAVFVDVSGSMDRYLQEVLSQGKYLSRIADVKLYIFADRCKLVPPSGNLPDVGGGTQWEPVKEVIDSLGPGYEITLVSDMCFFDEQPKIDPNWFVIVIE